MSTRKSTTPAVSSSKAKAPAKAPVKKTAQKRTAKKTPPAATKNAAGKPLVPATPAKAKKQETKKGQVSTAKLKVLPVKSWKTTFKAGTVSDLIVQAIKEKQDTIPAIVKYWADKPGLGPNKSQEYLKHPERYVSGYITFLKKNAIVANA